MNFSFLLRFALKELLNHKKLTFFMVINLTISLVSFVLINSFKESVNTYVVDNSKSILTADLSIYSRRPFSDLEKEVIANLDEDKRASLYKYFSMIKVGERTQLINVSVFNQNYPLYGKIEVADFEDNEIPFSKVKQEMMEGKIALISEEAKIAFDLAEPTEVKIGKQNYLAKYIVKKDIGGTINFNEVSKKIYLSDEQHDKQVFQTKGNLVRRNIFIKLAEDDDLLQAKSDLSAEFLALEQDLSIPSIRTHRESRGQVGNVLGNVTRYLSLIAVVALFLSGVGTFYLFRSYIYAKIREIAIIESLGMVKRDLYIVNIMQLLFISLCSVLLSLFIGVFSFSLLPVLFQGLLPEDLDVFINLRSVALIMVVAFVGIMFFCLPLLYTLKHIKPLYLINENINFSSLRKFKFYLNFIPSIIAFYVLSVYLSDSLYLGTIFSLSFFFIILLIILLQTITLYALDKGKNYFPLLLNLIVKQFSHNKQAVSFYFFSISLSVLLISITPQMEHSLKQELAKPEEIMLPSLFLFNIQDFEEEELVDAIRDNGYELENITPMIFAQLLKHNGVVVAHSEEDDSNDAPEERRRGDALGRTVNLSYKEQLSVSEKIVAGKPFNDNYQEGGKIEISIEKEYASDRGLKLGDELTFKLINIPFEFTGEIINFREVKWNSFQPNFFILIHPEVLKGIPKQLVASISGVQGESKVALQSKINDQFANVSIVDVEKAIEVIFSIIDKMELLIGSMVLFCLLLGFFILFSIINYEVRLKEKEINLLKVMSNGFYKVYKMVILQYIILGIFSISIGMISSVIISYVFVKFVLEINFYFSGFVIFYLFFLMNLVVLAISYLGSKRVLLKKPILLLKST